MPQDGVGLHPVCFFQADLERLSQVLVVRTERSCGLAGAQTSELRVSRAARPIDRLRLYAFRDRQSGTRAARELAGALTGGAGGRAAGRGERTFPSASLDARVRY